MKRFLLFALALVLAAGCDGLGEIDETNRDWNVDDNEMTWGIHEYTTRGSLPNLFNDKGEMVEEVPKNPTAWVTFTHNPEGYNEFSTVYNEFLGKTPTGAAAMIPMAMELYGRHAATGEKCFRLLFGSQANANNIIRVLETKMHSSTAEQANDPYVQRYLPAALLKGARAENSYTPDEPYTVQMLPSAIAPSGDYLNLYIFAEGWDINLRGVEVKKVEGHYVISTAPACYSQCREIKGEWAGLR